MDPNEAAREAAHHLIGLVDDVEFPVTRERLVDHLAGKELVIGPGNVIRPADVLRRAPDEEYGSPVDVARRLLLMGAIRAGGEDLTPAEENLQPGHQGEGQSYESAWHQEPPAGSSNQATAPPANPQEEGTKGVRRPPA